MIVYSKGKFQLNCEFLTSKIENIYTYIFVFYKVEQQATQKKIRKAGSLTASVKASKARSGR